MEKYGVMHEYRCKCGTCIVVPDNNQIITMKKTSAMGKSTHVCEFEEVLDDKQTESGELRLERSGSEEKIRTDH
jgi:hypothetical protein